MYRDSYNGMIAGVCQGLGDRFNITPGLVRVFAVVSLILAFPITMLVYILMWLFIPNR